MTERGTAWKKRWPKRWTAIREAERTEAIRLAQQRLEMADDNTTVIDDTLICRAFLAEVQKNGL